MSSPSAANDGDVIGTPVLAGNQMSSSLRERLKRSGRCYKSPGTSKRLCQSRIESSEMCQSPSSSSVYRENSAVVDTTPDAAIITISNAKCNVVEADQAGGNIQDKIILNIPTDPGIQDITGDLCENVINPYFDVTPRKVYDANADNDVSMTPLRDTRKSTNEERNDAYNTPCRKNHGACDVDRDLSSTPVRSTDQTASDMIMQSLKKRKMESLKRIAREEEMLRKLKMVKMYRTKNNLTELQRLIDLWRCVSQRALEQLLEQTQEPGATLSSLIDHLQLRHELIGYSVEDESFV